MEFKDLPRGVPRTSAAQGNAPRALWMDPDALIASDFWHYESGKIVLGRSGDTIIGATDNRHLMTIAGSRAGKGTSAIVPNLLIYPGSVLVLDPKGENATLTAERRGLGRGIEDGGMNHDVFVIDPFHVANVDDVYRAGFNPLVGLDPDDPDFIDECDAIADALVVVQPGEKDNHWNSAARLILRGYIAWVGAAAGIEARDLNEVRRLLYLPSGVEEPGEFEVHLATMLAQPEVAHGIPAEAASALVGMGPRERGTVLSTIRNNIGFLSSPPMAKTITGGDRSPDLKSWKFGGQAVYLCLPAGRMHRHFRFFRLFINRLLGGIEGDADVPDVPALMLLDEMHVLGHMAQLETAAGLIAGYGVRIWSIWQDLAQLKHIYGERWETFLGNASILQCFGLNDLTSLEYISKRLGTSSTMSISQSEISGEQMATGFSGQSKSIQESPLLTPDEVAEFFSRQSGKQLVLYPGASPIFLSRLPFYDDIFATVRITDD